MDVKKTADFPISNFIEFRTKMLNWAQPFNIFCFLDNRQYDFEAPAFECMLAVGCKKKMEVSGGKAFAALSAFNKEKDDWIFGHLGYDLKNETEQLSSNNFDGIQFPDCFFFIPEMVLRLNEKTVTISGVDIDAEIIFNAIGAASPGFPKMTLNHLRINGRVPEDEYIQTVKKLQEYILRGDCYEINFCQEFYAIDAVINPLAVYHELVSVSPNPFSALYKLNDKYCICASPERYLKKRGRRVFCQPIKGTAKRNLNDCILDEKSRQDLYLNEKERSENVMVVDLVRNDLSKVCVEGSVRVDELFGIYSFPQVHQMISTVSGELRENLELADVISATFPMGSMTGAPKKRVMQLIEQYEKTKRGLFSGALGYIDPKGDGDFNVVIRSILYNASAKYLSFETGSAITFYSDAKKEYEECLLKGEAMRIALSGTD